MPRLIFQSLAVGDGFFININGAEATVTKGDRVIMSGRVANVKEFAEFTEIVRKAVSQ